MAEWLSGGARRNMAGYLLLIAFSGVSVAQARVCTPRDAAAADALVDHLDSWAKIDMASRKYAHCDDGEIAEGYSEAVARLLVDRWDTLPQLESLIKRNPRLEAFVIRHVDSTLDTSDLERIRRLSISSCPQGMTSLCTALAKSAAESMR